MIKTFFPNGFISIRFIIAIQPRTIRVVSLMFNSRKSQVSSVTFSFSKRSQTWEYSLHSILPQLSHNKSRRCGQELEDQDRNKILILPVPEDLLSIVEDEAISGMTGIFSSNRSCFSSSKKRKKKKRRTKRKEEREGERSEDVRGTF